MRRPRPLAVLVSSVLLLLAAGFWLGDALRRGEDALIARQYPAAVEALQAALDEEPVERQDRVLLLLARAQFLAGDQAAAIATYERLVRDHPDSPLRDKAALQRAETLAASGRFADAAAVYREQIARLTRAERKEQVAETYLGLADRALSAEPPDPKRAVTFYDLALELGLGAERGRGVRLLAAEALLRAGDAGAIPRFSALVDELPEAAADQLRARLGLGRSLRLSGDPARARTVLRDLISLAPDSEPAADAAHEVAMSFGVPEPGAARLDAAIAALRAFASRYPEHPKAGTAEYQVARCQLSVGRSEEGLAALRRFLDEAGGRNLDEVADARALVGFVLFGQGRTEEAIEAWREYLQAHPAHGDWQRVQRAIVDAELARAFRAEREERWEDARRLYEQFGRDHPLDERNAEIALAIGEAFAKERRFDEARLAFERCVKKFPGRDESSRAQFRIGEIHERDVFDYQRALEAYRAVTWGRWETAAKARIAQLERKALRLRTARTFRSGEPAAFEVSSRNIGELRVRVYRLDLETWFRATHLPGSVERLDIEVIAADRTFASATPDYLPFRETTREVPIGFDQPGCYVVKVDDQELEATTMVLVTDIGLIVKSSRRELFVFTQDLKEERVRGGVRVVVSDGERILHEGVTGADGVLRWRDEALRNAAELRVFAVDAAGSGAGTLDLSGLGYAEGLSPRAYLFSDRPAYQPGDPVHLKGIVRDVVDGRYVLPRDPSPPLLRVLSPSGRALSEGEVLYTAFGSFAADLVLPAAAETGTWRIELQRGAVGGTTAATFEVARYELPRVGITIEPGKPVVHRGEPIAGRVLLRHFYGEPVIGRPVTIELQRPDGTRAEARGTTNAEGALPFSFESGEFAEEALAVLQAGSAEDGVTARTVVPVVTSEFEPSLSLRRPVQLVGQPFEVTVGIVDRGGRPLVQAGELVLLRREQGPRGVGEVEVGRARFRTEAEDGRALVMMRAEAGGEHLLRVLATDRFEQVVTAEIPVTVSGDEDAVRLRILADRQSLKVGDSLEVTIVNRAPERLALRTIQADGVLEHAAVRIPTGESRLRFELRPEHAPNFALALAMIDGTALHTAEQDFEVARDLQIRLRPETPVARPGATVTLAVEAADSAGRPVAAEFALALCDEALFELFEDRTPAIGAHFFGARRETAFRTVSSCSWAYEAAARPVSAALAAEERRRDEELEGAGVPLRDDARASAFDSNQWNSAVGLAGGSGGPVGGRPRAGGGGPGTPGPAGPATPGPAGPATGGWIEPGADRGGFDAFFARGQQRAARTEGRADHGAPDTTLFAAVVRRFEADLDEVLELESDRPRALFAPDGAWLSAVVTGADGKARVELQMPLRSGGWRLVARGVTVATDVGEARADLRTAEDLVASVAAPTQLVAGDRTVARGSLHNRTSAEVELGVRTRVGASSSARIERSLAAGREVSIGIEVAAAGAGPLGIGLSAEGGLSAAAEAQVEVLPFGVERRAGRAGMMTEGARFELALPAGRGFRDLGLTVEIGAGALEALVAAALAPGAVPANCRARPVTWLAVASRGLAAVALLEQLDAAGGGGTRADRSALESAAEGALTELLSAQLEDGSLAWIGQKTGDLRSTAAALRLFAASRARGDLRADRAAARAGDWLIAQLRAARDEVRFEPERALAEAGRGRFEALNALHRRRATLDLDALGRLALAWRALGRAELAAEVDAVIAPQLVALQTTDAARVEAVALAVRSLLLADPKDPRAVPVLAWLDAQRVGSGWATAEATAEAVRTLAIAGGAELAAASQGEVTVLVNGREIGLVPLGAGHPREAVLDAPAELLRPADNMVELQLRGRGKVRYVASLRGFADGFVEADRRTDLCSVERRYLPALLRIDGRVVAPGFSVVSGRHESLENVMTQLPVGASGRVETRFVVAQDGEGPGLSPVLVEEPIPAGCTVPRESVTGSFEHFEILPGRLVFYYRDGQRADTIRYELVGRFEGRYRALPTVVRGAQRPDLAACGTAAALEVLPRDRASADRYRMSPDELWAFGQKAFADGDLAAAGGHLEALIEGHTLRDEIFREVAKRMLFVAIGRGDARGAVRWFEEMKDRAPDFVVPFDAIGAVGQAYIDLGEFEAALLVYRATAEASFVKEANVATTLQQLGEVRSSVRFLRRLLDTYPDLNTMRQSLYGIAQRLGLLAADQIPGGRIDPRVGDAATLRGEALATLREFLVLYPDDPLAEEVSFAWATTLIEAGELEQALAVAEGGLRRYPGRPLEDEFLYTAGYARFVLGRPEPALDAVRRVAVEDFARPGGGRGPSENRRHAIYLEAQIHHASGRVGEALAAYDRVAKDFSDAGEAAGYFRREELSLPEVTRVGSRDAATLVVTSRNLPEVAIKVYRVDLMRLYLLHKSLDKVRDIQLHGIAPFHEAKLRLDGVDDHAERRSEVGLPLAEEGAYLVVARAGEHLASGMVLRSDLRIEAQESFDVGRVRVNVEQDGRLVGDADVKVVGSGDGRIQSGRTDLRGIFVADGVVGRATVLVRVGEGFAFHRGDAIHQPGRMPAPPRPSRQPQQQEGEAAGKEFEVWGNNFQLNDQNRRRQIQWLDREVLERQQKGVEVFRAK